MEANTERLYDDAHAVQKVQRLAGQAWTSSDDMALEMMQDATEKEKKWLCQEDEIIEKWLPTVVYRQKKKIRKVV